RLIVILVRTVSESRQGGMAAAGLRFIKILSFLAICGNLDNLGVLSVPGNFCHQHLGGLFRAGGAMDGQPRLPWKQRKFTFAFGADSLLCRHIPPVVLLSKYTAVVQN